MLHEVIARDHGVGVALATLLLDAGARTDIRDDFLKSTPLGWACRWGRVELVKLLLARGADSDRARGRAVGHTALVGRTASTCGDCIDPPATRS